MRFRKLRIAWSVGWMLGIVLLPAILPIKKTVGSDYEIIETDPVLLWPLSAVFVIAAIAPWIPTRFSLRTLLIATTLVAVVLGLVVWAGR